MTIAERVIEKISESNRPICDDCIAHDLDLKSRQQANRVTNALGHTSGYLRRLGSCIGCGGLKLVIIRRLM